MLAEWQPGVASPLRLDRRPPRGQVPPSPPLGHARSPPVQTPLTSDPSPLGRSLGRKLLALAAGALVLPACSGGSPAEAGRSGLGKDSSKDSSVREREATPVLTAPLEQREMTRLLETTSVLESEREVEITPRSAGFLVELMVEEGDAVEAGQVLAQLDDEQETLALREAEIAVQESGQQAESLAVAVAEGENAVTTAQTNLAQAERDLERDEALRAGTAKFGSVSEKAVEASRLARDQAAAELERSRLTLQRARLDAEAQGTSLARAELTRDQSALALERRRIRAPFDGIIAERRIRVGAETGPGQPAFVLTDPTVLRTVFFRPQSELARFTSGGGALRLTATAEALPGSRFRGEIQRTSPTIEATSGNFRVTARLDPVPFEFDSSLLGGDPPARLLPGMLLRLELVTDSHPSALVVPKRALQREGDRVFVYASNEGIATKLEVTEGFSDEDSIEILGVGDAKLTAGMEIVVVGARDLEDGEPIRAEGQ